MESQSSEPVAQTEQKPVAVVAVEFSGADGLTFTIKASALTSAQWAVAAAVINHYCGQSLAVAEAAASRRAIVPASAMPGMQLPASLAEAARKAFRG